MDIKRTPIEWVSQLGEETDNPIYATSWYDPREPNWTGTGRIESGHIFVLDGPLQLESKKESDGGY